MIYDSSLFRHFVERFVQTVYYLKSLLSFDANPKKQIRSSSRKTTLKPNSVPDTHKNEVNFLGFLVDFHLKTLNKFVCFSSLIGTKEISPTILALAPIGTLSK